MNELLTKNKESKEQISEQPELLILDMDGTIIIEPDFYRRVYSQSLNDTVFEERGEEGLQTLAFYRENFENNGHFSLGALGIPFRKWAEKLESVSLEGITPRPEIVEKVRKLPMKKVVLTGSPRAMAIKMLTRFGFDPEKDFAEIIGWEEPELWPLKWTCSPFIFSSICKRNGITPDKTWAIGDNWQTDLNPPKQLGIRTIQIQQTVSKADDAFESFSDFVDNTERIVALLKRKQRRNFFRRRYD